jgi:hypothetical protein
MAPEFLWDSFLSVREERRRRPFHDGLRSTGRFFRGTQENFSGPPKSWSVTGRTPVVAYQPRGGRFGP